MRPRLPDRLASAVPAAVVGGFAGIAAVAGSYAAAGFTPTFVVRPVAAVLTERVPDAVLALAIERLGSLGQRLNFAMAVLLVVVGVGALATLAQGLGRRLNNRALPVVFTAVGTWAVAAVLTGEPMLALGAGLPAGAVVLLSEATPSLPFAESVDDSRRRVVTSALSVAALGAVGYVLGQRRTPRLGGDPLGDDAPGTSPAQRQSLLDQASERSLSIAGLEPLVSTDHYQVDINSIDPTVDESEWTLTVTGAVEEEVSVTYDELRSMEATDRFETLRCVGDDLNGKKMDTALWTGVPIMDVVEQANPDSGCGCVMLRAEDGFFEEFPIEAMANGLLAYGMNGEGLPRGHGYPVRALVPGHWGEIQVKWLTEIEILDEEADGYWEQRGWHGTGPVETVAKLHAVNDLSDGRKEVGGHAYAGTRGIQSVEVSTDGGDTWTEADLSDPLPAADGEAAPDAWRQWRYAYDPPDGPHEVVVRATDGTGAVQPSVESGSYPSGATGWVSRTVR